MWWLRDKDDNEFKLDDETWTHITTFHPEITSVELVESILQDPDQIVRSIWDLPCFVLQANHTAPISGSSCSNRRETHQDHVDHRQSQER